jgi:hypothetical protein
MTDPVVHIQVDPTNSPSTPSWFGEVAVVAHALQRYGVLKAIQERVRFVRARMGKYELIDFVAMLIGYAVSGEPTLRAFCERVQPFASEFMALFGRADFPTPPTLSRYLAVLDQPCVEALRTLFLEDPAFALAVRHSAGRAVGSAGWTVAAHGCGWHQTSGSPTRASSHPRPASGSSPL